jgi:hypothetical protein
VDVKDDTGCLLCPSIAVARANPIAASTRMTRAESTLP